MARAVDRVTNLVIASRRFWFENAMTVLADRGILLAATPQDAACWPMRAYDRRKFAARSLSKLIASAKERIWARTGASHPPPSDRGHWSQSSTPAPRLQIGASDRGTILSFHSIVCVGGYTPAL